MKIAVDAMGGDHAPEAPVQGAFLAVPQCPAKLVLIGDEGRLRGMLDGQPDRAAVEILHTAETIDMGEAGPVAIRKKRGASLSVAMRLLADREVDAVVSAGNTSAIVAAAKYFVGLVPGLRRPALAVPIPTPSGRVVLIDAGAQAEAQAVHLAQSAALAHAYLKTIGSMDRPRVGLLNIGREPLKGLKVIQRTFTLLRRSSLHFIGNVEPQDLFSDQTDIVVCDGFVGNLLLKMFEVVSETFVQILAAQLKTIEHGVEDKFSSILHHFAGCYDYQNIGGAPLLGVRRAVLVAHGRSRSRAIANAILVAHGLAGERCFEHMSSMLDRDGLLAEMKHHHTMLILENLRKQVGLQPKE
jgi:phosphate acyltransferase